MNYFKMLTAMQKGDRTLFEVPVKEQQLFLNSLGAPKDDIDRSFKQYLCQHYFVSRWKILLLNFLFIPIPFFLIIVYIIKGLGIKKKEKVDAIASLKLEYNIFATDVLKEFDVDDSLWGKGQSLQLSDLSFCMKVFAKWVHSPYFVTKNIVSIAVYSDMIYKYSPKALLSHCEFSCTSSILTAYCKAKGVEHINTMHGEKLFYIRDSFFRFDRCYIWDNYYADLFVSMKAEPTQFRVSIPNSLKFDTTNFIRKDCFADYKYILALYTENELRIIANVMKQIEAKGNSYKLRPHPRYSNKTLLNKYFDEKHIEYPEKVSIQESVSNCKYIIGSYTTVLSQAYYSGKNVVLDDVAYKSQFDKLFELKYIMTTKDSIKLSNILN